MNLPDAGLLAAFHKIYEEIAAVNELNTNKALKEQKTDINAAAGKFFKAANALATENAFLGGKIAFLETEKAAQTNAASAAASAAPNNETPASPPRSLKQKKKIYTTIHHRPRREGRHGDRRKDPDRQS